MATFKLNVYGGGEVQKTYECESYDVLFGTFEDLLALSEASENEAAGKVMDLARPLLHDMFPDISAEDLRRTKMKEVFALLANAIAYAASQMGTGGTVNKKKQDRGRG